MPSSRDPVTVVQPGPGRLPGGTVPASALLFPAGGGSDAALQAHITDPVNAHMATAIGGAAVAGTNISLGADPTMTQVTDITDFINLMLDSRDNTWGGKQTITATGDDVALSARGSKVGVFGSQTVGSPTVEGTGGVFWGVGATEPSPVVGFNNSGVMGVGGTGPDGAGVVGIGTTSKAGVFGRGTEVGIQAFANGAAAANVTGITSIASNPGLGFPAIGIAAQGDGGATTAEPGIGVVGAATGLLPVTAKMGVWGIGGTMPFPPPTVVGVGGVFWGDGAADHWATFSGGAGVVGLGLTGPGGFFSGAASPVWAPGTMGGVGVFGGGDTGKPGVVGEAGPGVGCGVFGAANSGPPVAFPTVEGAGGVFYGEGATESLVTESENAGTIGIGGGPKQLSTTADLTADGPDMLITVGTPSFVAGHVGFNVEINGSGSGNDGLYTITQYVSATAVKAGSPLGALPDANNGAITVDLYVGHGGIFRGTDGGYFYGTDRYGIYAESAKNTGILGLSHSADMVGVYGKNDVAGVGYGVFGMAYDVAAFGVYGRNDAGVGVCGTTQAGKGIQAITYTGGGTALYAYSPTTTAYTAPAGVALHAQSTQNMGIYAQSGNLGNRGHHGIYGECRRNSGGAQQNKAGIYGFHHGLGPGVAGKAETGIGGAFNHTYAQNYSYALGVGGVMGFWAGGDGSDVACNPLPTQGFGNTLAGSSIPKMWALIECGGGGPTIRNGFNIGSVAYAGANNRLTFTFGSGMDSTAYAVAHGVESAAGGAYSTVTLNKANGSFDVSAFSLLASLATPIDLSVVAITIEVIVFGTQTPSLWPYP